MRHLLTITLLAVTLLCGCGSPAPAAVLVYSANGTYTTKTTLAAAAVAPDAAGKKVVFTTDQTLTANLAWPADRELVPENSAKINHGAYTIDYAGSTARWPLAQVFNGTGAVTLPGSEVSYPEWFGTNTIPGTTNMTTAIRASFAAGPPVTFPFTHDYMITDTVTYLKGSDGQGRDLTMNGSIKYTGPEDRAALVIGANGDYFNRSKLHIKVYQETVGAWTDMNHIGIHIYCARNSEINIERSQGFTIGVKMHAKGFGFDYNKGKLNYLIDNKYSVYAVSEAPDSGGGVGYFNENHFFGGHFGVSSTTHPDLDRFGVVITTVAGHYPNNNKNYFDGGSYEMAYGLTTGVATGVQIEHGVQNHFRDVRFENSGSPNVRVMNASSNNEVTAGYGNVEVLDTSTSPSTYSLSSRDIVKQDLRSGWNSGNLGRKLTQFNSTDFMVAGLDLYASSGGTSFINVSGFSWDGAESLITTSGRGIGISIDTSLCKRFVVFRSGSSGGRVLVKAFDAAGNVLIGTAPNYVQGITGSTLPYTTSYGGGYQTSGDGTSAIVFTLEDSVAKATVIITSGTAALNLKAFSIYALDNASDVSLYTSLLTDRPYDPNMQLVSAIPVKGVYATNTIIKRYPFTVGQPKGWYTTTGGGASSTTRADATAYAAGVWAKWPSGTTVWECTTAGTSTTGAPSIVGKVVGDTVEDGTAIWTMRSLTTVAFTSEGNL